MAAPKLKLTGNRGKLPAGMPPESGKLAVERGVLGSLGARRGRPS